MVLSDAFYSSVFLFFYLCTMYKHMLCIYLCMVSAFLLLEIFVIEIRVFLYFLVAVAIFLYNTLVNLGCFKCAL